MKRCSKCNKEKPLTKFHKRSGRKNSFGSWCKDCMNEHSKIYRIKNIEKENRRRKNYRACHKKEMKEVSIRYNLKRQFNLTPEQYDDILTKQNGRCAICGIHQSEIDYRLAVDHSHSTGNVRGLLCHQCNMGIGNLNDSVEILRKAIEYLERRSCT
jgi:hypothetical protein